MINYILRRRNIPKGFSRDFSFPHSPFVLRKMSVYKCDSFFAPRNFNIIKLFTITPLSSLSEGVITELLLIKLKQQDEELYVLDNQHIEQAHETTLCWRDRIGKKSVHIHTCTSRCKWNHLQFLASNSIYDSILNPLKPELNPICYLLALLAQHFLHVSRIRVKSLTFRRLMSYIYIYMEHLFLMFLDHTQRRSTVGRTPLDE